MKMSLCIPMYNENSIIADTAKTLSDYMAANFDDYEIIFPTTAVQTGATGRLRSWGCRTSAW